MRAPPEQEMMIRGCSFSRQRSMARVIISPTTTPMEPLMKEGSMAQTQTVLPPTFPSPASSASFIPEAACISLKRRR